MNYMELRLNPGEDNERLYLFTTPKVKELRLTVHFNATRNKAVKELNNINEEDYAAEFNKLITLFSNYIVSMFGDQFTTEDVENGLPSNLIFTLGEELVSITQNGMQEDPYAKKKDGKQMTDKELCDSIDTFYKYMIAECKNSLETVNSTSLDDYLYLISSVFIEEEEEIVTLSSLGI